jgi:hypothetical protein
MVQDKVQELRALLSPIGNAIFRLRMEPDKPDLTREEVFILEKLRREAFELSVTIENLTKHTNLPEEKSEF